MWCCPPSDPLRALLIAAYTEELKALHALLLEISKAPLSTVHKVVSYTVQGRQVSFSNSTSAEVLPSLRKDLYSLSVAIRRETRGGVPISYGVPR